MKAQGAALLEITGIITLHNDQVEHKNLSSNFCHILSQMMIRSSTWSKEKSSWQMASYAISPPASDLEIYKDLYSDCYPFVQDNAELCELPYVHTTSQVDSGETDHISMNSWSHSGDMDEFHTLIMIGYLSDYSWMTTVGVVLLIIFFFSFWAPETELPVDFISTNSLLSSVDNSWQTWTGLLLLVEYVVCIYPNRDKSHAAFSHRCTKQLAKILMDCTPKWKKVLRINCSMLNCLIYHSEIT